MSLACEFKKWRDSMKFCTQCGSQLTDDAKFCTVCGSQQAQITEPQKPVQIYQPPERKENAITRFFGTVTKVVKVNFFPLLILVSLALFLLAIFTPHTFTVTAELFELEKAEKEEALYGDMVLSYGESNQGIFLCACPILMWITLMVCCSTKARKNFIVLGMGLVTFALDVALLVGNGMLRNFEMRKKSYGEWITADCAYDLGATNLWLILAGIILLVAVVFATFVEREKYYQVLRSVVGREHKAEWEALVKERDTKLFWGIFFLGIWFPFSAIVSVFFFLKCRKIKKQIAALFK